MKFFVDTAEVPAIAELHALGMVDGVTTNPSLCAKAGIKTDEQFANLIHQICELVQGPVSAEVTATDEAGMLALGGDLYVKKATLEYHASARFDEMLDIRGRMARLGRSSMVFRVEMYRGDEHLITGEVVYVCADPKTQKSAPIPASVRERIEAWETVKPAA